MGKKLRTMEREHFPLSHSGELVQQALSAEQERERLARWLRKGELYDPRNEPDYDSWTVGMEPIPGDQSWTKEKAPNGALEELASLSHYLPQRARTARVKDSTSSRMSYPSCFA